MAGDRGNVKRPSAFLLARHLELWRPLRQTGRKDENSTMSNAQKPEISKPSREERLAAKLRENLRRRKAQSRALEESAPAAPPASDDSQG